MLAALVLVLPLAPQDAPLSKGAANALRELYLEALADPSGRASKKLVSEGRKLEKNYRYADLVEALREGPRYPRGKPKPRGNGREKEEFEAFGSTVTGFRFEHDGHAYRYLIDFPRGYDENKPWAVLIDPGHGAGREADQEGKAGYVPYWRNQTDRSALKDCLIVRTEIVEQVGGGAPRELPEDRVVGVFEAFFRDLGSRVHVDPDRVYVSGLSQTGFWVWYLGRARPDRWAGLAPMGAVTWQVDHYLENYSALPVYVLHGEQDAICPVEQPRRTTAAMKEQGYPLEYEEVEGGEHNFSTWGRLPKALNRLAEQGPRNPYPRAVAKRLQTEETPWCYWIRITELKNENKPGKAHQRPTAFLEAKIDGQEVAIRSDGVKEIELCLSREMLDLDADMVVEWNGKRVHKGPVKRDFARCLEVAVEKADWSGTFEAFLKLKTR